MNPIDFLQTAELLKKERKEAHLRTSIGRSYYAAFLYFREKLKTKGLEKRIKPSQDAHAFIIQCLAFSQVTEGTKASRYLQDLQQLREDADYDLMKAISAKDAEDALSRAQTTIANYKANITPTKEENLLANATQYAQQKGWI